MYLKSVVYALRQPRLTWSKVSACPSTAPSLLNSNSNTNTNRLLVEFETRSIITTSSSRRIDSDKLALSLTGRRYHRGLSTSAVAYSKDRQSSDDESQNGAITVSSEKDLEVQLEKKLQLARKLEALEDTEETVPRQCEVLVIGGGAVGASIAYHLKTRKGHEAFKVTVVERDNKYTQASTVLSVGGLRQQFSLPENIQLSLYGADFLRNASKLLAVEGLEPPDVQFNPHGYLTLASEAGVQQLEKNYDLQRSLGAKTEFLTAKRLKNKFPWINCDGIEAGVHGLENEGWFDPWTLLMGLKMKASSLGALFINGNVTGFERTKMTEGPRFVPDEKRSHLRKATVQLDNGKEIQITFGICVIAAGAWSGDVGRLVGLGTGRGALTVPIPVEKRKRYVYAIHCPEGPGLDCPLVIDPTGAYFRREGLGGLYICGRSPSEEDEPIAKDLSSVNEEYFYDQVWPVIANRAPLFENIKLRSSWAGYYDYNYFDQNGIIGYHPICKNLILATGFSGHGIQQAPGVGRAITELIVSDRYETINLQRFGFERILADRPLFESGIV